MKFNAKITEPTYTTKIDSGKRDAVRPEIRPTVHPSVPVLKEPTLSLTAGRKPAACPADPVIAPLREALQPKGGGVAGQRPADANRGDPSRLSAEACQALAQFFQLLDNWEKRTHETKTM
jgi:hypothetical protein